MRMRSSITLLVAALSLPAGGCMMKPRHLVYPQGVTFTGWHPPNFECCTWRRDPNNPGPCPLVAHRPGGDLGDKEFADASALRRAGWAERDAGNGLVILSEPASPAVVSCAYENGVLAHVSVSVLAGGAAELSVGGRRVGLPATEGAITAALGQPLRRD